MTVDRLHPALRRLLVDQGWAGLTPAQDEAAGPLAAGDHTLLIAPTGHGKTEAALLPVLSRILTERDRLEAAEQPWPSGFKALYVTPLRALNRDLMERLTSWSKALGIRMAVRHGDTTQYERAKQSRDPPDLLITTPETVQLLLYGDRLRRHLRTVRFVIVDEVHDLAAGERGAQLAIALERIEEVIGQSGRLVEAPAGERPGPTGADGLSARPGGGFQRIGLSATVADPEPVATFLGGQRDVTVVRVDATKERSLTVLAPQPSPDDDSASSELSLPLAVVAELKAVRRLIEGHERVLVFQNSRDGAELMASRSALLDDAAGSEPLMGLHHGSLSPDHRADVEDAFKAGRLRAMVATSSLELGIDVGAIDHVVQVHSPRSVARLLQRLGRAGHRLGVASEGTLLAGGAEDTMECLAVARAAIEGRLERIPHREAPLVVLANQLVALSNEYASLDREWTRGLFLRAGPYLEMDPGLFDAVWDALLDLRTVFPPDDAPQRIGRSGRGRRHFLDHVSLIPDARSYRVLDEATKRSIGTVDDAFVAAAMHPGAVFVMAGRSWTVLEVEAEEQRVRVAPAKEIGAVPQWAGSQLPVSYDLAQEVARLRDHIARRDADELAHYDADAATWTVASEPVHAQVEAGLSVPTHNTVTLESGARTLIANIALGTRGNEALGRITQALLHQRIGTAIGMDSDAYRIHFTVPAEVRPTDVEQLWRDLEADTLDLLVAMILRGTPMVRHHLVHVAKQFGALPKALDPNRFSRQKLDALMDHLALQEETMARLVHERLDLEAVSTFLAGLHDGSIRIVHQAIGPLARLGDESARRMTAPKPNEALMAAVRDRVEGSDVLLVCTQCRHHWQSLVRQLPPRLRCRRCSSIQIACLRPWNEDKLPLLAAGNLARLDADERLERNRILRNGQLVAGFGSVACRALVGRGVGPDTAARILQKITDPANPHFWREILEAELQFARTNVFWNR